MTPRPRDASELLRRSRPVEQPEPEPEPVYELTDAQRAAAASAAWRDFVTSEVRQGVLGSAGAICEAIMEVLADRDQDLQAALTARDKKIERLELDAVKRDSEVAKLALRVAELAVEVGRHERRSAGDWIAPSRRELN
jgi:hypothetical protein